MQNLKEDAEAIKEDRKCVKEVATDIKIIKKDVKEIRQNIEKDISELCLFGFIFAFERAYCKVWSD